jgi:hypothetical protein
MNVQWDRPLIAVAFLGVLALIMYGGFRLHRPFIAFAAAAAITAATWVAVKAAISSDYRDADGYGDCWPNCTLLQNGVGTMNVLAPLTLILLAVALVAFLGFVWWHGRHPRDELKRKI